MAAHPHAHPDRMAATAVLHGLRPPDPRRARVLELGCGSGEHLLAMAVALPGAVVSGVEEDPERVAAGRRAVEAIGLSGVELRVGGAGGLGDVDYVVARGVPAAARDAVLAAVHPLLAADGLACVEPAAGALGPRHGLARVGDAGLGAGVFCRDAFTPAPAPDPGTLERLAFGAPRDAPPADGLLGAAVDALGLRSPRAIGFVELRRALAAEPAALAEALVAGVRAGAVTPHVAPPRAGDAQAERPEASPLARWQAARGAEVTSLSFATVRMDEPAARALLTLLDGTRDRAAIRADFAARTGLRLAPTDLDANLERLARLFLLLDPGD